VKEDFLVTKIAFLMLTFNRLRYTRESVESLLANDFPFHLAIHDNGSTEEGMIDYLQDLQRREERVVDLTLAGENLGLPLPTSTFWDRYLDHYPYLGKIDNDTIVPPDGVERLADIMDHCPRVAVVHGYHWLDDRFDRRRLKDIDGRLLLPGRWGGGCFYLIRSSVVRRFGGISEKYGKMGGWSRYQIRLRRRGHRVVYAYPLVRVTHLGHQGSGREEESGRYREYNEMVRGLRRNRGSR
jgi:GT2 family glycosyltransferase